MKIHIGYFITAVSGLLGWILIAQVQASKNIAVLTAMMTTMGRDIARLLNRVDALDRLPRDE